MRVHELAKELGFDNKEFIDRLKKVGVDVKSHLSGLSDDQEKSIRDKMKNTSQIYVLKLFLLTTSLKVKFFLIPK